MVTKYALEKAITEHRIASNNVIGTAHSIEASRYLVQLIGQADNDVLGSLGAVNKEYCTLVSEAACIA